MSFILGIDPVWTKAVMRESEVTKQGRSGECSLPEEAEILVRAHRLWIWGAGQSQQLDLMTDVWVILAPSESPIPTNYFSLRSSHLPRSHSLFFKVKSNVLHAILELSITCLVSPPSVFLFLVHVFVACCLSSYYSIPIKTKILLSGRNSIINKWWEDGLLHGGEKLVTETFILKLGWRCPLVYCSELHL